MSEQEDSANERDERVLDLAVRELERRNLRHVSYNAAVGLYHTGRIGQDDLDLVIDTWSASPHVTTVLDIDKRRAIRNLKRRFGLWEYLPEGVSRVECPELAIRIADGEFHKIGFCFYVSNPAYPPLYMSFDDEGLDYVFEEIARMVGSGDEPGRYMEVEHQDGDLYLLMGQYKPSEPRYLEPEPKIRRAYVEQCPNCEVGHMVADDYVVGQLDGDFTIDLHCNVCMTTVIINVEKGDEGE